MPHPGQLHLVVPTCIVVKAGQVLIIKRAAHEKVYPGKWCVPGGKLDRSEYEHTPKTTRDSWYGPIEATLRREVKEETNLEIEKPQLLVDLVFIRPDNIAAVTLSYWAKYKSGEVKISEDFDDFAWVKPKDAAKFDMIDGIPGQILDVEKLLKTSKKL